MESGWRQKVHASSSTSWNFKSSSLVTIILSSNERESSLFRILWGMMSYFITLPRYAIHFWPSHSSVFVTRRLCILERGALWLATGPWLHAHRTQLNYGSLGTRQNKIVAAFNQVSRCIINFIFPWLLAEFHSFKCFPEHGNSKTVNDRIYQRIGQTKEIKDLKYN